MEAKEILLIVLREMNAIGEGWRADWSDFDGRTLRGQLDEIDDWARKKLDGDTTLPNDFVEGSNFLTQVCPE